jgi:predicted NUDIX family NTP pyrophosphohydrolase
MPLPSAGLLMYRTNPELQVLLIHPGGPFFAKKDKGVWGVPKGEYSPSEDPLNAAVREFNEETGFHATPPFLPLGEIRQRNRKLVTAWAFAGDCDPASLVSNTCEIDWPPRSGRKLTIPEVDQGRWFTLTEARDYMRPDQHDLLARLEAALAATPER